MVFRELEWQANTPAFFCSLWRLLLLWAWEHIPLPVKRSQPPTCQPNCSSLMSWCLWRMRWLRPRRKEVSQDLDPRLTGFLRPLWMLKANRGKFLDAPASDRVGRRLLVGVLDTDGLALAASRFTVVVRCLWSGYQNLYRNHCGCMVCRPSALMNNTCTSSFIPAVPYS